MSMRYPGGVISATVDTPNPPTASGVWDLETQMQAQGASNWPNLPGAPTSVTATAGSGDASVAFTAPSNAGIPAVITSYIVTSSPGGFTGTGSSSPITVSGLTNGTAYTFTVQAVNASGTGPASAESNSVTPVAPYIEDVFSTYLYTGNGGSQTITNNIDLSTKGGMVWIKSRLDQNGPSSDYNNQLTDTSRGVNNFLASNTTDGTNNYGANFSFSTTGFSMNNNRYELNRSGGETYTSWTFREQAKFFDVVTYTGNGTSGRNISHNLGSAPGLIIIKQTDTARLWAVYHRSLGATQWLSLNGTGAAATNSSLWNDTEPTSSQFTLGNATSVNQNGGTYVAYLFAHNAGGFGATGTDNVISCGSISGASTINLGYEPQWVMVKRTDSADNWYVNDNMRGLPTPASNVYLLPNSNGAEATGSAIAPTSTGFTWGLAGSYVYVAIRRGPMRTPTVGTTVFNAKVGNTSTQSWSGIGFNPDLIVNKTSTVTNNWFVGDRLRGGSVGSLSFDLNWVEGTGLNQYFDIQNGAYWSGYGGSTPDSEYAFGRAPGFFDVVCYTGTGSTTTQTHNLGVAPEMMILKSRTSVEDWPVYVSSVGNNKYMWLNGGNTPITSSAFWNNTTPTSSVFTIGTNTAVNDVGKKYVAYLFATLSGVSKVGSYTGTGGTQTINCGFTTGARYILIKNTNDTTGWYCWNSADGLTSGSNPYLRQNSDTTAVTGNNGCYAASSGFTLTSTANATVNVNGNTYIYLAIA